MTLELIDKTIAKLENEIATAPIEHRSKLYDILLQAIEKKRWHSEVLPEPVIQPQAPIGIPVNSTNIVDEVAKLVEDIKENLNVAIIASEELITKIVISDEFKDILAEAVKKAVKAK